MCVYAHRKLLQCILGYLIFNYSNPCLSELTKACYFYEFLQDGGHCM